MSELTESISEHLPDDFNEVIYDDEYGEETAAKNYGVPILKELGLLHADYEEWIDDDNRPDFVWSDEDSVTRIVGEFKKPWDKTYSESNPRYKIEQGSEEARAYNDILRLKYILVSDGRYIYLSNEYAAEDTELELDLRKVHNNPDDDEVEDIADQLKRWITDIYSGNWNEKPSERDISEDPVFADFIQETRDVLNNDLLNSIERVFDTYQNRYEEYETQRQALAAKREDLHEQYRGHRLSDLYKQAIDGVAEDLNYDYEEDFKRPPKDVDKERCIEEIEKFSEELLGHRTDVSELKSDYRRARNWHDKWNEWLILTGKDYDGARQKDQDRIRETFQLQTLNVLYNRILLIRSFEDMGIIGQVISDGFINFFDEKVQLHYSNKYLEPLITASRQAEEVYSPLFQRDTPHDWYRYEEEVLKSILRRFDNFNFRNIDRDIFGEMYQRCLDREKRKRLGAYYTPHSAISVLLDYVGFTSNQSHIKLVSSKAIDPACGSGAFVLEAMHRIVISLENSSYDFSRDEDLHKAINIINTKLRGFDLDPFAVQLTQSNLLIRVLQERRDATVSNNGDDDAHLRLPQFSIFETDSLLTIKESGQTNKERYYRAHEKDPSRLKEIIDAKEDDYDFVFGNPPYVRPHNQDEAVTDEYERLHDTFGNEQSDVFIGFVEQALEWLEDGGRLAFVISNKLLVTEGSEDAMQYILDNATIDLIGDLTRCKIFGFDVNVFPTLIVLTKRSGDEYEDERKDNETDVVKVYVKGSKKSNEWVHTLDHAAADLIPWRDAPDYDFAIDFESDEYPDITTADTYDCYKVPQSRFTEDWGDWSDRLALNFQITETLWDAVGEMEDTDNCIPLRDVCKIDEDGTPKGVPGRGIEPNKYREYTVDDPTATPVVSGASIEPFYLGDTEGDVKEYIDIDAVKNDDDTRVSSNKLDSFVNKPKLAYCQTSPKLSFTVDDPSDTTRFYNLTGYFLLMRDMNGTLTDYTDGGDAVDLHYIAGLLNSDVLDFYYKAYYEQLAFRHAPAMRNLPSYLHHLPIHVPSDEDKETIKSFSKSLHTVKRELKRVNHNLETLFEKYEERGDTVGFRTKVASIVESRSNYSINTFTGLRDGTKVELNRYHTVEMHSEEGAEKLASFLEDFGDKYIGGDKLRNLELPSDLDEFRVMHDDLKDRAYTLSAEIDKDMVALNDEVYKLYGLEEYRDDIEEYLESFLTVIK